MACGKLSGLALSRRTSPPHQVRLVRHIGGVVLRDEAGAKTRLFRVHIYGGAPVLYGAARPERQAYVEAPALRAAPIADLQIDPTLGLSGVSAQWLRR